MQTMQFKFKNALGKSVGSAYSNYEVRKAEPRNCECTSDQADGPRQAAHRTAINNQR